MKGLFLCSGSCFEQESSSCGSTQLSHDVSVARLGFPLSRREAEGRRGHAARQESTEPGRNRSRALVRPPHRWHLSLAPQALILICEKMTSCTQAPIDSFGEVTRENFLVAVLIRTGCPLKALWIQCVHPASL